MSVKYWNKLEQNNFNNMIAIKINVILIVLQLTPSWSQGTRTPSDFIENFNQSG